MHKNAKGELLDLRPFSGVANQATTQLKKAEIVQIFNQLGFVGFVLPVGRVLNAGFMSDGSLKVAEDVIQKSSFVFGGNNALGELRACEGFTSGSTANMRELQLIAGIMLGNPDFNYSTVISLGQYAILDGTLTNRSPRLDVKLVVSEKEAGKVPTALRKRMATSSEKDRVRLSIEPNVQAKDKTTLDDTSYDKDVLDFINNLPDRAIVETQIKSSLYFDHGIVYTRRSPYDQRAIFVKGIKTPIKIAGFEDGEQVLMDCTRINSFADFNREVVRAVGRGIWSLYNPKTYYNSISNVLKPNAKGVALQFDPDTGEWTANVVEVRETPDAKPKVGTAFSMNLSDDEDDSELDEDRPRQSRGGREEPEPGGQQRQPPEEPPAHLGEGVELDLGEDDE